MIEASRQEEAPERTRIRKMLIERGVLPVHITERLIDFWIVQDTKDQHEGRILGCCRPNPMLFGSGQ